MHRLRLDGAMQRWRENWHIWALAAIAAGALALGYDYITGTPFYEYLDAVNPENHRH